LLRVAWITLPLTAGPAAAASMSSWSDGPRIAGAVLLWVAWAGGLLATLAPRPLMLTALRVMETMARTGKPLAELMSDLKVFPQMIQNVRVKEKVPFVRVPEIQDAINAAERELDGNGRVVVRYSGTEALARVMIEAESEEKMKALAQNIAGDHARFPAQLP
jgi:hypothetical protein